MKWLLGALSVVVLRALPALAYPVARDQATYCVIARGLLDGQELYRDLWDNKPPGIFYIFTLIVKIFGPVMWWVGIVDLLWLIGISCLIFYFARRYLGNPAAAIAVVVHGVWHVQGGYWHAAQTETFLMVFVFLAFFAVLRDEAWPWLRYFSAGILLAAAFWIKYNAIAFLPLVMLLPHLDLSGLDDRPRFVGFATPWRRWMPWAVVLGSAFGLAVIAVLAMFWFSGAWPAMKEVQFEVLPRYSTMAIDHIDSYWLFVVRRVQFVLGIWTECATLAALLIAFWRRELSRLGPILAATAVGFASTAMQVRYHGYTFETSYPFFAMIWGYLAVKIWEVCKTAGTFFVQRGWRLARVLVWIAFANVAVWFVPGELSDAYVQYKSLGDWIRDRDRSYAEYPWAFPISHFQDQMRVIAYLRANSAPSDKVFVWGSEPLIYFITERRFPTRFVTNLALISPWAPSAWRSELVDDLKEAPPRFFIVARDDMVSSITYTYWDSERHLQAFPELAIFIDDYYEPAEVLPYFTIYRRRSPKP
ncbi:MAG: ArnT family glycosyltransferase [Terriglobia bacterium]